MTAANKTNPVSLLLLMDSCQKHRRALWGQQKQRNRRWVLASRPHGAPVPENFRLEEDDVATPGEGQVLLRTVYLSLDPYMRGRMSDEPSYSPPVDIGGVMVGGTVSRVVESNHPDYQPGDWCWATVDGRTMTYPVVMIW